MADEIKCNLCDILVKKENTNKIIGLDDICYLCIYKMKIFMIV